MNNIINLFLSHIVVFAVILCGLALVPIIYNWIRRRQAEKTPNNLAFYFKKYNLSSVQDAWNVIQDPKTPPDDKAKISSLIELFNKINEPQ